MHCCDKWVYKNNGINNGNIQNHINGYCSTFTLMGLKNGIATKTIVIPINVKRKIFFMSGTRNKVGIATMM